MSVGQDIQKSLRHRVLLLLGNDQRARLATVNEILKRCGCDDGMDSQVFIADEATVADWTAAASTIPFLAEKRVIVVRNLARVNPSKTWPEKPSKDHVAAKEFLSIPETGLIVLVADDESGDEPKQRVFSSNVKVWQTLVQFANGGVLTFNLPDSDTPKFVTDLVKKSGKQVSKQAAVMLAEMVSGKADAARDEVEKLLLYVGDREEIQLADIKDVVTPTLQYNIWQLIDAVVAGNSRTAIAQLRHMLGSRKDVADEGIRSILPMMARQFRFVWQARGYVASGAQPSRSFPDIEGMLPSERSILKEKDWSQNRAMRQATRLTYDHLLACMNALVDADAKLKGQRPAFTAMDTLEQMVLEMCSICHQENRMFAR
ncbi:DNA polymerase III subunit delta [Kamptonema cortianum]|nr:DNA polymerase III subunit delta [Geitlerinema splendidum]MDK3158876.1 DNA polymerase III subunit delta [Kamptonema cortianum]